MSCTTTERMVYITVPPASSSALSVGLLDTNQNPSNAICGGNMPMVPNPAVMEITRQVFVEGCSLGHAAELLQTAIDQATHLPPSATAKEEAERIVRALRGDGDGQLINRAE